MTHWEGPSIDAWEAWSPVDVRDRLAGIPVPWCVVGGWAIDLAAGRQTRRHGDLEIAVLRRDFATVRRAMPGFDFFVVGDGEARRLGDAQKPPPNRHQNWVFDPVAQRWRVDVMLESGDAATWVFRREPSIAAERSEMVALSAEGVPYLRPHGALLYKAKGVRAKDESDLQVALPLLAPAERAWLAARLDAVHPGHAWLDVL